MDFSTAEGLILVAQPVHVAISDQAMLAALPAKARNLPRHSVNIDAIRATIPEAASLNWSDAERLQLEQFNRTLKPLLDAHPQYRVLYFGAAPIPLAIHLGNLVGGWTATSVFLHHHERKDWRWGRRSARRPAPRVKLEGVPTERILAAGDVVIRVSTSHLIDPSDTTALIANPLAEVDIKLEQPSEDVFVEPGDLEELVTTFKEVLDTVARLRPNAHTVHLFASVQVGVAFHLGTQIRCTIHPNVQTYQFWKQSQPRYRPAILLSVSSKSMTTARPPMTSAQSHSLTAAAGGDLIEQRTNAMPSRTDGLYTTDELTQHGKIRPWARVDKNDYFIPVKTFGDSEQERVLDNLQRFGIAQVRYQGTAPSTERLLSIESWLGPARESQNGHVGKIKSITPSEAFDATTGDSAKELLPHVDGTQDTTTPAILVFEYETSPTFGGDSTFIDMARVLLEIPDNERWEILEALSQPDAAVSSKKGLRYEGPLIRPVCGGAGISVRLRFDPPSNPVMQVNSRYRREFDLLRSRILNRPERLTYSPQEGDVVFFDNWRLLHGRLKVGGRHLRFHNRMWIDRLVDHRRGEYLLGVRGLSLATVTMIEQANGQSAASTPPVRQAVASDQALWELTVNEQVRLEPLLGSPVEQQSDDYYVFNVERVTVSGVEFKKLASQEVVKMPFEALSHPWRDDSTGRWRATIKSGSLAFGVGASRWEWKPSS